MPTVLFHAAVPAALGLGLGRTIVSGRLLIAGAVVCVLPDADVVGMHWGIAYASPWGHRGASHSIAFAMGMAALCACAARLLHSKPTVAFAFVAVCAASHALLDMLTDGGLGAAWWWPWTEQRYFLPWRVIEVSPLDWRPFLGEQGLRVLQSELLWIGLPALAVWGTLLCLRWRRGWGKRDGLPHVGCVCSGRNDST